MDAQSNTPKQLTALSAGLLIRELLTGDPEVMKKAKKVFPVVTDEAATLPYLAYRQVDNEEARVKGHLGSELTTVEIVCYAEHYGEAVAMSEAVRNALDNKSAHYEDEEGNYLDAKAIHFAGAEDTWADDAFSKDMLFTIKIG